MNRKMEKKENQKEKEKQEKIGRYEITWKKALFTIPEYRITELVLPEGHLKLYGKGFIDEDLI